MEGMVLWKLEIRADPYVNTQSKGVVGERSWADELLPTQVMSGHGAFNAYLFHMKQVESLKCANCDRRGRDDDAWHTLLEGPTFQLYWEDAMTTPPKMGEQPLTTDSLVQIMLKSRAANQKMEKIRRLLLKRGKKEIRRNPWELFPLEC